MIVQALAGIGIELLRRGERLVPAPSCAAKLHGKDFLLFCSRIEPDAGCCQHSLDIGDVCLSVNGVLWLAHIPRPEGRGFTLASDNKELLDAFVRNLPIVL